MKHLIHLLLLAGSICTPTSVILWIFASDLGLLRDVSVYLLLISLSCLFVGAVLESIYDFIYDEN